MAYRSSLPNEFLARGDRKVTTGITGSWPQSVHSDVAVCFFDVGSSYLTLVDLYDSEIVHLFIGNVSWV